MGLKCPACGFDNLLGEDRCTQCFSSLMQRDIPRPKKDDAFQSTMMTASVSALLTGKDLLVTKRGDSIAKIVKILQKTKLKCIVVYHKKKIVGILSNRDLLRKVSFKGKDLSKIKVEEVMTPNPEFVKTEDPIAFAVNKMSMGGFRHLPVLADDGTPLSIISIKDVLTYLMRQNTHS